MTRICKRLPLSTIAVEMFAVLLCFYCTIFVRSMPFRLKLIRNCNFLCRLCFNALASIFISFRSLMHKFNFRCRIKIYDTPPVPTPTDYTAADNWHTTKHTASLHSYGKEKQRIFIDWNTVTLTLRHASIHPQSAHSACSRTHQWVSQNENILQRMCK